MGGWVGSEDGGSGMRQHQQQLLLGTAGGEVQAVCQSSPPPPPDHAASSRLNLHVCFFYFVSPWAHLKSSLSMEGRSSCMRLMVWIISMEQAVGIA